ncbi:MAG TPA: deoxyribodipyrimidine photo-lyase [Acidimicrobiales bacterium]|nr:deoxyribodipyrimidine photo-lyase [Acidimicrobiales bacterium]
MAAPQRYETVVVLFTCDLRVHDHPALWHACASARTVVPLFVVDPACTPRPPASGNRPAFLAECLADLRATLRARGGDLFVRTGDTVRATMEVVGRTRAEAVFLTEDVSALARARRERLARAGEAGRCRLEVHPGSTVVPSGELLPAGKDHYAVFTPFWHRWHATPWRPVLPAPRHVPGPRRLAAGRLPRLVEPGRPLSPRRPPGGETAGRARWARWARRHLDAYDEGHDDLAGDRTSRLSAYLHFGCLSPLELARHAGGHESFVRQLCWRDFHHQVVAAFPELPRRDYRSRERRWRRDPLAVAAWREGRTGVPIVDAAMRQLRVEGFVHNRARMLAASHLVKDLGLDWRVGAAHFADWLVDADVANNSGNWQWVAGTGNDTRPNRRFNLVRQARRHDPEGIYVRRYVGELAGVSGGAVHEPWLLPAAERRALGYPAPRGGAPAWEV